MYCQVETKDVEDVRATNIIQQSSFWAKVKSRQGFKTYAFTMIASDDLLSPFRRGKENIQDDLLIFIQYVNARQCIAYIPYGPKIEPMHENYGVFLEELSEAIRPNLPPACMLIRYDLPWENQWAQEDDFHDEKGHWIDAPSIGNQEFRVNFNTRHWNLSKSPSDMLPTSTYFLDLRQNEEHLLVRMKPKTRYNIRLSERKGVRVQAYGLEKLDRWYALYGETARRNHVTLHHKDYFYSVLKAQQERSRDASVRLLIGEHQGEELSAMFLVMSKNRGTYLYGASASKKRNLMASYALQWEAIKISRQAGCREYDMFGSAPNANPSHPLYGLYRFKSGFGGRMYHRMGCWDYPLNNEAYDAFKAQEVKNQQYHLS